MKTTPIHRMLLDKEIQQVAELERQIFPVSPHSPEELKYEMGNKTNLVTLFAEQEGQVVGYKIGYERKKGVFYSWIGGVVPEFRRRGLARQLMATQHQWLKEQGFQRVQTQTGNEFSAMLCLNIKSGFLIKGTSMNHKGKIRIILEKTFIRR